MAFSSGDKQPVSVRIRSTGQPLSLLYKNHNGIKGLHVSPFNMFLFHDCTVRFTHNKEATGSNKNMDVQVSYSVD